jgi:flagellar motor switch protein FliN/FliY
MDNQACNSFAITFARFLARSVSDACGNDWQIDVASPQPDILPASTSPLAYSLHFSDAVAGVCFVVFEQADLATLVGGSKQDSGATLLAMLRSVASALEEQLGSAYGELHIEAEPEPSFDGAAGRALVLRARDGEDKASTILLHFDAVLAASFAALPSFVVSSQDAVHQSNLDLVLNVELNVTLRFGQRQLTLREILDLASGSVVELDRQVEEPVELILDGRVIARGEAVIIDGNYGMRVTQVLQPGIC